MIERRLQLVVLLSGTGRTMVNVQECIAAGRLNARIRLVISSRREAKGVALAKGLGLATKVIDRGLLSEAQFQRELTAAVVGAEPDLVCMAGFLRLWEMPAEFRGRVINIHPALLPEFGGKGLYGRYVHEAVLRAGKAVSGCTVHFCDNEYDHGPVILQRTVAVMADDTPETLAARVFEQECVAYPEAIRLFSEGRITLDGQRVHIN
ncbi:MAG: phosphoribosylglycinamide formyltransferase [Phycisphaerae bacterium]